MPFLVRKGRPSKINKRNSFFFFLKFGFSGIEYGMHVFKDDFWRQFSNGPHKKKSFLEKCIWDEGLKYSSALLNVGFIHKGLQKSTHNHCTMLQKLSKCEVNVKASLCWNSMILAPLQFYVKSNFANSNSPQMSFFGNYRL